MQVLLDFVRLYFSTMDSSLLSPSFLWLSLSLSMTLSHSRQPSVYFSTMDSSPSLCSLSMTLSLCRQTSVYFRTMDSSSSLWLYLYDVLPLPPNLVVLLKLHPHFVTLHFRFLCFIGFCILLTKC